MNLWLLYAIIGPALYALANIIDEHLSSNLFKRTTTLIFYASLLNLVFVPIIFLFGFPKMITLAQLPYFLILGLTGVGYLYPYYKALQKEDTSVVVSLFSLGRIFIPILAFFIVGETLQLPQYIGFGIIVVSGALLSSRSLNIFKLNKSFFLMMAASFILAIETVIYKSVFNQVDWVTGFTWATIFMFLFSFPLLISKGARNDIKYTARHFKKNIKFFIFEELLSFGGAAFITLAISLASVSVVKAVGSLQPFFVLIYVLVLRKFIAHPFREETSKLALLRKAIFFALLVAGIVLVLKPEIVLL